MPPIASWEIGSSCVRRAPRRLVCLSSPRLPRFAYPNGPRTGSPGRSHGTPHSATRLRSHVMKRCVLLALLAAAAGCGGQRRPPTPAPLPKSGAAALPAAPTETPGPLPAVTSDPERDVAQALLLPPAPDLDTLIPPNELAAELRIAADS